MEKKEDKFWDFCSLWPNAEIAIVGHEPAAIFAIWFHGQKCSTVMN